MRARTCAPLRGYVFNGLLSASIEFITAFVFQNSLVAAASSASSSAAPAFLFASSGLFPTPARRY